MSEPRIHLPRGRMDLRTQETYWALHWDDSLDRHDTAIDDLATSRDLDATPPKASGLAHPLTQNYISGATGEFYPSSGTMTLDAIVTTAVLSCDRILGPGRIGAIWRSLEWWYRSLKFHSVLVCPSLPCCSNALRFGGWACHLGWYRLWSQRTAHCSLRRGRVLQTFSRPQTLRSAVRTPTTMFSISRLENGDLRR